MTAYKPQPCIPCGKKYVPLMPKPEPFIQGKSFGRPRVQPNGTILYPKKSSWEPPPPIQGYERDPGNAWHFLPLWPDCQTRQRVTVKKKCGAIDIKQICLCPDCPFFKNDVKLTTCQGCTFRRAQPFLSNPRPNVLTYLQMPQQSPGNLPNILRKVPNCRSMLRRRNDFRIIFHVCGDRLLHQKDAQDYH